MSKYLFLLLIALPQSIFSQVKLEKLTVEKIMRDPKWMGTSPSNPYWSNDGQYLFFSWNPDNSISDSIYYITPNDLTPKKASASLRSNMLTATNAAYNNARTAYTFDRNGDIYYVDAKTKKERRITQTADAESNPQFSFGDTRVVYSRNQNLFAWDINTGATIQLTNLQRGATPPRGRS
jgi:Tol biopolymer transport system component